MPERGGDASEANEAQQETTREPRVMHRQAPGFSRQAKSISIFLAAVACQLALVSNFSASSPVPACGTMYYSMLL
jgi:hypothetical protein